MGDTTVPDLQSIKHLDIAGIERCFSYGDHHHSVNSCNTIRCVECGKFAGYQSSFGGQRGLGNGGRHGNRVD